MSARYTTTGRDSWSHSTGYRYQSKPWAALAKEARAAGQPSVVRGVLTILFIIVVAVGLAVAGGML